MLRVEKIDRTVKRRKFVDGAWLTMRPATSIESIQAETEAAQIVADWLKAPQGLREFGLDEFAGPEDGEDMEAQVDRVIGLTRFLVNALLFEMLVTDWDGVGDADGNPIEITRKHIGMLLSNADCFAAFERLAWSAERTVSAEGNACAASPNGSVEAAETIAKVAPI